MNRNYPCIDCNLSTQNPRLYLQHRRDNHGDVFTIHECDLCIYATKHSTKLVRHRRTVHRGIPAIEASIENVSNIPAQISICTMCSFRTLNKLMLIDHIRVAHPTAQIYKCDFCNYSHYSKDHFTRHQRYHSMHRVQCHICEFKTIYKWNLDRHMRHHNANGTGVQCTKCNFTAATKQSVTSHQTNHHRLNESISLPANEVETLNETTSNDDDTTTDANAFNPFDFLKLLWGASLGVRGDSMETVNQSTNENFQFFHCQNCNFRNKIVIPASENDASNDLQSVPSVNQRRGYRCGHCHQISNWKHVIQVIFEYFHKTFCFITKNFYLQRHCRLVHSSLDCFVERYCSSEQEYQRLMPMTPRTKDSSRIFKTENNEEYNEASADEQCNNDQCLE